MKQLDFEHGTVTGNILGAAVPMLVAQILNLLYNIVDRIYIAQYPQSGNSSAGSSGTLLSTDRDHHGVFEPVRKRRRTVIFHSQGEKGDTGSK